MSKTHGVTWDKQNKKWLVNVTIKNKRYYIGHFNTEIEATKVWEDICLKENNIADISRRLFGINKPDETS